MSALGVLHLILLETLAFAFIASTMASLATRVALRTTAAWSPASRHRACLFLAVSPLILAVGSVLATLTPSFLGLIWPKYDHCLVHPGMHLHLCLVHLPTGFGNVGSWLVILAAIAFLSKGAIKTIRALSGASRLSSRLLAQGFEERRLSACVLPISQPLCLTVGIFRPTIVVSEGLLRSVTAEQLAAVLAHEQAHVTRHDTFFGLLARATTVFMWPSARNRVLRTIELAAELSCDEAAARAIGDRLTMAEVILRVERLLHPMPSGFRPVAISFGETAVELRVSTLLEPLRSERRFAPVVLLLLGLALLFALCEPLHHVTETLLGALVR